MFNVAIQLEETNRGKVAFSGLAQSIIVGAISGAVTSGIGSIAKDMMLTATNLFEKAGVALFQASMHGMAQGVIQGITGGSFEQNFLTAAISSLAGSAYGAAFKEFANKGVGQVLFSTVAGGTTAAMQGGNFWQGAGMGFTIGLLNHAMHAMDPPGKKSKSGFLKKNAFDNSKTSLDFGDGAFGALESTVAPGGKWLGKNGKYYSKSWGGNGATGSRAGALKAASNYKWAGRTVLGASVVIGGVETYNGYQMDGGHFGYNAQSAAASTAGSIAGGWAGAEAGVMTFGAIGGMIGGPPGLIIGGVVGGFIGGFGGGYAGGEIGQGAVNYIHR